MVCYRPSKQFLADGRGRYIGRVCGCRRGSMRTPITRDQSSQKQQRNRKTHGVYYYTRSHQSPKEQKASSIIRIWPTIADQKPHTRIVCHYLDHSTYARLSKERWLRHAFLTLHELNSEEQEIRILCETHDLRLQQLMIALCLIWSRWRSFTSAPFKLFSGGQWVRNG